MSRQSEDAPVFTPRARKIGAALGGAVLVLAPAAVVAGGVMAQHNNRLFTQTLDEGNAKAPIYSKPHAFDAVLHGDVAVPKDAVFVEVNGSGPDNAASKVAAEVGGSDISKTINLLAKYYAAQEGGAGKIHDGDVVVLPHVLVDDEKLGGSYTMEDQRADIHYEDPHETLSSKEFQVLVGIHDGPKPPSTP